MQKPFFSFEFCIFCVSNLVIVSCHSMYDYSVSASRAERFYPEIRKYYPNLKDGSLQPSYSGIRPKISGPRQSPIDFVIQVIEVFLFL